MQQFQGQREAYQLFSRANLRMLFLVSDQFLPQKSTHRKTQLLFRLIPKESEHNLWSQFFAWTDRSWLLAEWHPTKPSSSSNCHVSVGKLSASDVKITWAMLFLQNSLSNDSSAILIVSPLVKGLFRFSGLKNSLFRLKEPKMLKIICCIGKLIRRKAQRLYLFSHRLWEDRWSTKIKPCLCVNIIRCSTVHLVRVRAEFVQCLILGLENSSWQWRRHITDLHREPFFIIFNRLSFWRQVCFNKSFTCATERWEVRNVTLESRLSVPICLL